MLNLKRVHCFLKLILHVVINIVFETIGENIQILTKESLNYQKCKQCKLWFDEIYSKLSDKKKQVKCQ
jgi:hypothetical protein